MENVLEIIREHMSEDQYINFLNEFTNHLLEEGYYYNKVWAMEDKSDRKKSDYDFITFIDDNDYQKLALKFFKKYLENKYIEPFHIVEFIANHKTLNNNPDMLPIIRWENLRADSLLIEEEITEETYDYLKLKSFYESHEENIKVLEELLNKIDE